MRNGTLDRSLLLGLEQNLNLSSKIVNKLSKSIMPWKALKNKKAAEVAAAELEEQKSHLSKVLTEAVEYINNLEQELTSAKASLANHQDVLQKNAELVSAWS